MTKKAKAPSERTVKAMLEKYACPVPYHEVRTRFIGAIATPALAVSPIQMLKNLWGGEFPESDSIESLQELIDVMIQGLWNDLTRHQKRSAPFRLVRLPMEYTLDGVRMYGCTRVEEVDGFIEGLFNGEDSIDLPEPAHAAVDYLTGFRTLMSRISSMGGASPGSSDLDEFKLLYQQLKDCTKAMETEMNAAVQSCLKARRQGHESFTAIRPTFH